jgi:HNH endonuclease
MSVKLLHPDARSLVESRFADLADAITQAERISAMPGEKLPRGVSKDFVTSTTQMLREVRDEYRSLLNHPTFWSASLPEPCGLQIPYNGTADLFGRKMSGIILVYHNAFYAVNGPYELEEAKLILLDWIRKKKRKAEYLVARKDVPEDEAGYKRQPILEEVRHEVWRRDRGRCAQCGSVHNLEFDHIVPVSRGGANTTRNIQLLCEPCNRRKSNNIG